MTTLFNQSTKQAADEFIEISLLLKDKMESWAEVFSHTPDSNNKDVTAGFITDWKRPSVMEILVEVRAPADDTEALARIQAIETIKDKDGNERFNQVSLHYRVDYAQARRLVENNADTTRDNIAQLMHANSAQLIRVVVSDETGKDTKTDQLLGKRHDFDADELTVISEDIESELSVAISKVLVKLKLTAQHEAKA